MKTILKTQRVLLRELVQQDARELYDLDSDPEVMRFMPTDAPTPMEHIRDVVLPRRLDEYATHPGLGFWAAIHRETQAFMGWFHFRPYRGDIDTIEIGYRLKRMYWNHGYATEVSAEMVEHAFAMRNVGSVFAEASPDNAASIRVMEKVGLRYDKTLTNPSKVVYVLKRDEWKTKA